jgi:dihydroflavonol-4-reductase
MLVTVTGGAGRLGNALVRALLHRGQKVRVLEPSEGMPKSLAGLDVELVRGSVLDQATVQRAVAGAEVVYHVAAKIHLDRDRDGSLQAVNVRGTDQVVMAVSRTRARLVHCSSHHALTREPLDQPLTEQKPLALRDRNDYHRTKAEAEQVVLDAITREGLDAVIVNPATMIGPFDYEPSMIGRALLLLARRELPAVINALTDYVDVRDVADGMIAAAERGQRGERYLLSGEVLGMDDILRMWSAITGVPAPRINFPLWFAWSFIPGAMLWSRLSGKPPEITPGLLRAAVSNKVVSKDKAVRALGYRPRPIQEALESTHRFFVEEGWLPERKP